jgi:xanthine dehydrogenase YagR molybdenum-binding subunit
MATAENPVRATSAGVHRVDGALKVSGGAMYTSDFNFPGMLYAIPVCSTIAKGSMTILDTSAAEKMPGVKAIYHRANIGRLYRSAQGEGISAHLDERRPPFEDDVIRYYGQYIAVVVAQTFEQAQAAVSAVKATYSEEKPDVRNKLEPEGKPGVDSERGNAEAAFTTAAIKLDHTYGTPVETHNPIELHASIATWDGRNFTLYETTQGVVNHREVLCQMLGVPYENVRIISRFLGSGFGGKLFPWPHSLLAAAAARNLKTPVKLVISRKMMFQNVGHRPLTQQRVRISATPDGKLTSLQHDTLNHTSIQDDRNENCGESTPFMYSCPNLRVTSGLVHRNVGSSTDMRGPGAVPGMYATESAMDELAIQLKMDPVKLRLVNEPKLDESSGRPFSSRHLVECLNVGAEKFGWSKRTPLVGSMKRDGLTLGWGMACGSWLAERSDTEATVDLRRDGTARVVCATQDIGTGTYTVLARVVSEKTGLPLDKIEVELGDSALPAGPISGGSWATASVIPAVWGASEKAMKSVLAAAASGKVQAFAGQKVDALEFSKGRVHLKGQAAESGVAFEDILKQTNIEFASGTRKAEGTFMNLLSGAPRKFTTKSFIAHFAEVTWQPEIARLRVSRVVTVVDAGRMINPRPARNQIEGAVVMGVGMALFEETSYGNRWGEPVNSSLADYILATNADSPHIDVTFLDHPDFALNELGARGVGEIGLAGTAAAITAAIYHATGVRVRNIPVHIEDLLAKRELA